MKVNIKKKAAQRTESGDREEEIKGQGTASSWYKS